MLRVSINNAFLMISNSKIHFSKWEIFKSKATLQQNTPRNWYQANEVQDICIKNL